MGSGCSSLPCESHPSPPPLPAVVSQQNSSRGTTGSHAQALCCVSIVTESEGATTLTTAPNTFNPLESGLPIADASPSMTHVTSRTSLKSSIVLDDDLPQLPPSMSLPPPRDSTPSESRASQLESRVLFNASAPSMPSFHTIGLLRGQSVTATLSSTGGGGGDTRGNSKTTTVTTAADPKLCQSVYSSSKVSGRDVPATLERSGNETWMEAAVVEMGLRRTE